MRSEIIQNPLVRQNLDVVSEAIQDLDLGLERKADLEFFCDVKTGQILYTPSMIPPHEMAILIVTLDLDHKFISWKIKESGKLLAKAKEHLEEMAKILKTAFDKIEKLGQLVRCHWQGPLENHTKESIIKQTWHVIDREGAERLLLKQSAGTFLFRKDPFAITLEEILKRGLKKSVQCYTLTYLDDEGIVRDRTVVLFSKKWTFYDDNPSLSGPSFKSAGELLKSMGACTQHPLFSHSVV